jgi:hypothetical protein
MSLPPAQVEPIDKHQESAECFQEDDEKEELNAVGYHSGEAVSQESLGRSPRELRSVPASDGNALPPHR